MAESNHLLRVLGLAFGLAAVVGAAVGQGVLRSPGIVAQANGSKAVLIGPWALGALLALLGFVFVALLSGVPLALGTITDAGGGPAERIAGADAWQSPN
ncbi:MAG: hypothetical protein LC648_03185 [Novosphingobium sp.]|nr:hypothetical protein [Novosphingobium sp.]